MKKISLLMMLISAVYCNASSMKPVRVIQTPDGKKITVVGGEVGYNDINGKMRRIEEDIENVERKMSKADHNSKKGMLLEHERNTLALEFIHEAQKYIFNGGLKRNDNRTRKIIMIMNNEAALLKKVLADNRDFPYLDYLTDIHGMFKDIRQGKIKYNGRIPKKDSIMLNEIQKLQRQALTDIHKKQLDSRRK